MLIDCVSYPSNNGLYVICIFLSFSLKSPRCQVESVRDQVTPYFNVPICEQKSERGCLQDKKHSGSGGSLHLNDLFSQQRGAFYCLKCLKCESQPGGGGASLGMTWIPESLYSWFYFSHLLIYYSETISRGFCLPQMGDRTCTLHSAGFVSHLSKGCKVQCWMLSF